jgi:hypothetical protein
MLGDTSYADVSLLVLPSKPTAQSGQDGDASEGADVIGRSEAIQLSAHRLVLAARSVARRSARLIACTIACVRA